MLASLATLGYSLYYLLACAVFPFGACRRCKGDGKLRNPFSRRMFRLCPRCDGTGRRVRIGRRIYTYLNNERRKGTR
ncbi:hypothetical protein OHA72_13055 [Dactylosporangium sp. NBC_01737]|uniref:hypothetical protein n=1 Tax=Dactylosporangium sp. NBC_01737 TaxID=2975959 RepID=UPI002E11E37B|nr:hypothetical protein OHA72_13055 [Dactylosporangium sp. NBC_01737]